MSHVTPKNILLLCNYYPGAAGAIIDHVEAFKRHSKNEYFILSNLGDLPDWLDLSRFDALVFHYSLVACYDNYISPEARQRIREFGGFKAAFVQDDYRWINDTVNAFAYMGIHALFPLAGPDIIDTVYSPKKLPNVRKETVLAGYVPQALVDLAVKPYRERLLDVGYRARKLPAWMGSHTLQKWQIAERFHHDAARFRLKVDISFREEDRIYGEHWIDFISNCRATLGTESGASICDFTGEIQRNVEAHLLKYPDEDFEILRDLFFKDEDCRIMMNVISPRCFESAALRTLMILYEGDYSGVLIPWRHYVPLKRDHSNMAEIVQILQSPEKAQKIIDQAFEEVAKNQNYSYSAMIQLVDRVMEEEWSDSLRRGEQPYLQDEFSWLAKHNPKSIDHISSQRLEKTLWFPFTHAPRISSSGDSRLAGPVAIELPLVIPMSVGAIAIRWDEALINAPMKLKLRGIRGGKIQYTHEISNVDHDAFQSISIPLTLPAVDFLELSPMADTGSPWPQHLSISVLGTETMLRRRGVITFKRLAVWVLVRCWHALPERVRASFRPTVGQIRVRLQRLFELLLGKG